MDDDQPEVSFTIVLNFQVHAAELQQDIYIKSRHDRCRCKQWPAGHHFRRVSKPRGRSSSLASLKVRVKYIKDKQKLKQWEMDVANQREILEQCE